MKMHKIEVNQIEGFRLGNAGDKEAATGCTVIICEKGAVAGADVRGGAPATRETDLLRSENTVGTINAVVLSGGSAFGLEASSGVMRYLASKGIGFSTGIGHVVPIVCGASLYDVEVGRADVFPDVEMGRQACENAYRGIFGNGNNGAGTGASCGKLLGMDRAMKTGLGTYAVGDDYLQVGAIAAVNSVGDIVGGAGNLIAGLRSGDGSRISGTVKALRERIHDGYADEWDYESVSKSSEEPGDDRIEGVRIERNRSFEMNDIAAAMMAAFENSRSDAEQAADGETAARAAASAKAAVSAVAAPAGSGHVTDSASAAAYVEAVKAEALARARESLNNSAYRDDAETAEIIDGDRGRIIDADGSSDLEDVYLDDYLSDGGPDEKTFSRSLTYAQEDDAEAEPAAAAAAADGTPVNNSFRSYDDVLQEAEKDDDDLGYDIPFNTAISCVITNAKLSKSQANKLASILHDAYARAIKPSHMTYDGDTIFVMATGQQQVDFDAFAALATDVLQYAIIDAALSARGAYGLPAARDMSK